MAFSSEAKFEIDMQAILHLKFGKMASLKYYTGSLGSRCVIAEYIECYFTLPESLGLDHFGSHTIIREITIVTFYGP